MKAYQTNFVAAKLAFAGCISRADICDRLKCSTPQATIILRRFDELYPGAMTYDVKKRRWVSVKPLMSKEKAMKFIRAVTTCITPDEIPNDSHQGRP